MKAKTDYPLILAGLLAGLMLGVGYIGGAVVTAFVAAGGLWLPRMAQGRQERGTGFPR
ncbi:MAG: hypothetical protein LBR95_09420 [Azoarcus sp.]|jgi:uncharacterized membrane protein (DUF441 family)|nr:hypothetical protein [Azoarcus sp.]